MRLRWRVLFTLMATLSLDRFVRAQNTDIESLAGITFNFANPGARSMAMGGAFLGLADDASAAEANPAGLTILKRTEFSLEGRHYRNVQELPVTGVYPNIITQDFSSFSRIVEVTFGSVVVPLGNFAVAAYYHQPLNYRNDASVVTPRDEFGSVTAELPRVYFPRGEPPGSAPPITREECFRQPTGQCFASDLFPFVTAVEIDLQSFGLAVAWKSGAFSLGAAARYHDFEEFAFTTRYEEKRAGTLILSRIVRTVAVQATGLDLETLKHGVEHDLTFTAGFKWTLKKDWSLGGIYKQGPEFDAPVYIARVSEGGSLGQVASVPFHIPDVAGIGVSYRPTPALTFNADLVHIAYSNLNEEFHSIGFSTQFLEQPFDTEDVVEVHAGAEYFFPTTIPIAIRAGWWRDPAHGMKYMGPLTCNDSNYTEGGPYGETRLLCQSDRLAERMLFPGTKDLNHYTIGVGLAWPRFQIDAAYDSSSGFKVGSVSSVFRF